MALKDMMAELRGSVPKVPFTYCKTLVNRAWADVRRRNLWSFLIFEANWSSPSIINGGTAAVTQGSTSVVLDATAAALVNADTFTLSFITQRQFRVGIGTIYNIYGWDGVNTLTLDRPYAEATRAAVAYSIYQVYYAAPMQDFETFISVRDLTNFIDLFLDKNRAQIDATDPQRTWFYFPTDVVPYQLDQNPLSSTYRFPMFELWGAPQYNLTWQLYGLRKGTDLVNLDDTLPPAVGEDCIMALARMYAYEWAEANRDIAPRHTGPDYRFLMGVAQKEYQDLFSNYRRVDRDYVNNYFDIRRRSLYGKFFAYYNSISGTSYPGVSFGG